MRSVKLKLRNTDASTFQKPGPLITFFPRFPKFVVGCAKHCVVTVALHLAGVNQVASRPLPFVTSMGPGPNQLSVLLLPGALRLAPLKLKSIGVPVAMLRMPFTCQPPTIQEAGPEVANFLPFPNGSS